MIKGKKSIASSSTDTKNLGKQSSANCDAGFELTEDNLQTFLEGLL